MGYLDEPSLLETAEFCFEEVLLETAELCSLTCVEVTAEFILDFVLDDKASFDAFELLELTSADCVEHPQSIINADKNAIILMIFIKAPLSTFNVVALYHFRHPQFNLYFVNFRKKRVICSNAQTTLVFIGYLVDKYCYFSSIIVTPSSPSPYTPRRQERTCL